MEKLRNFDSLQHVFIYFCLKTSCKYAMCLGHTPPPLSPSTPCDPLNTPPPQLDVLFVFYNPLSPVSAATMLMNVRSSIEHGQPANVHSLAQKCDSPHLSIWLSIAHQLRLGRREAVPAPWWVFIVILLLQVTCSFEFVWAATMPCAEASISQHPSTLHLLRFLYSLWPLCHNVLLYELWRATFLVPGHPHG